jgi:hypothetical protein
VKEYIDVRVVGQKSEIRDFIRLCKVIQCLGRVGSCRTIKVTVDGDGSGRLAFYGVKDGKDFTEFNSEGIDVDDKEMLDMWIGE